MAETPALRHAKIERQTLETTIRVELTLLEGAAASGKLEGSSGIGFLDHMLTALAKHGGLLLHIGATGDRHIDDHHLTEDLGIVLGQALAAALGDMRGVTRFGDATVPLDESLALCVIDLSGRPHLSWDAPFDQERLGDFDTALFREFFQGFVNHARLTLHVRLLAAGNSHHRIEAIFKAFARALRAACALTGGVDMPSTKGLL